MKTILFAIAAFAQVAHADLPTWRLLGLEIVRGTETLSGYGIWSSYWLSEANAQSGSLYQNPQPRTSLTDEELLSRFRSEKEVRFVKDVARVNYPVKCMVATSPIEEIPRSLVSSIKRIPRPHDGYTWYGEINVFSPRVTNLLQKPPVAQCEEVPDGCKNDICYGSAYWLSYNDKITSEALAPLCKGPLAGLFKQNESLSLKRVYRFEISGD